jgi:hypothetical protein
MQCLGKTTHKVYNATNADTQQRELAKSASAENTWLQTAERSVCTYGNHQNLQKSKLQLHAQEA